MVRAAEGGDAATIAHLHCQAWRETYRGLLPDAMVDGLTLDEALEKWTRRLTPEAGHSVFLGLDGAGQPVGFASGRASNEDAAPAAGLLDTLYLVRAGQGLGLGRRLLEAVASALVDRGFADMIVVVHAENPAARFYAAMGAARLGERERLFRGHPCPEILWSWRLPLPQQAAGAAS